MDSEVLDNKGLLNHTVDLTFINGPSFSNPTRIGALVVLVISVVTAFNGFPYIFIGIGLGLGMAFIVSSSGGTDICLETKYVREYHKRLFLKSGKWRSTFTFTDISIISRGKAVKLSDMGGSTIQSSEEKKVQVVLLIPNHRQSILIKECDNLSKGIELMKEISEKMDKKVMNYHPQISMKTQERLRYRR
jgi:hypothetical protein